MEEPREVGDKTVRELDLRGQICPATLLQSLQRLNRMREELRGGASALAILTSNRNSTETVSEAASRMGYRVAVERERAHYRIRIEANPEMSGGGREELP